VTRGVIGIRWVATGLAVVLTVGAVLAVAAVAERNTRAALRREIETRLQLQARNLAASSAAALLGDYPELTLVPLLRELRSDQPELAMARVVDHDGRIQGDSDPRVLGTAFSPPAGFGAPVGPLSATEFLRIAGPWLVSRSPVRQPDGRVIGAAYIALPLQVIDDRLAASHRQQMLTLGLFTLVGAIAAFLLMSRLLRPMGDLRAGLERIGRGDLDTPIRIGERTELGLLAGTVNEMAVALKRAQTEMLERERLAHEVELAREIQRSLLPAPEVRYGVFEVRGDQRAAAEVGGDYWDVLPLPDGRVGLAIADVAGKGLAGCLVMSMLSALLRTFRHTHHSPAALLAELDARLSETLRPGVFVTMCYSILDPATGRLTYASAGHNPLVVWRRESGAIEVRSSHGIPLAAIRGGAVRATLRDESLQLDAGDVCVQFTDGYTEAFREGSGEQFGIERLEQVVAEHAGRGGRAVLAALESAVRVWAGDAPPADDETLLVLASETRAPDFALPAPDHDTDETELRAALGHLTLAERHGAGLALRARLDQLEALESWVRALPEIATSPATRVEIVTSALYETCANIVEHGCDEDGRAGLEVWWLPEAAAAGGGLAPRRPPTSSGPDEGEARGWFVIRDTGRPFRPEREKPTDFRDPAVRTRGRGIGLEIIHRAVSRVAYHPATARGNVTILTMGIRDSRVTGEEIPR